MFFTFSPFMHLENWLLSAVKKSLSRSQGFNSMSLFCFVAVVGQQNYTAKEFKSCKSFCDERAWVAFFACKVWSGLCAQWLFSKCADGHTARTETNWVESLKLKLAASLPEFTHFDKSTKLTFLLLLFSNSPKWAQVHEKPRQKCVFSICNPCLLSQSGQRKPKPFVGC